MSKQNLMETLQKGFQTIENQVSAQDRKDCILELGVAKSTLSRYLSGQIADTTTGEKIYVFLKKNINERTNKINKL